MGSGWEPGTQWQYGKLAALAYQLDKPIGTSFGDVELYQGLLSGVTGEVLEPAVGTGRMLIPLLERGLRIRGYDPSAAMLAVCRANCAARGLDPAGRLIVDVEPPQLLPDQPPLRHWWHGDELLTLTGHNQADAVTQRTTGWLRYELWREGELVRTELQLFTLQWYGLAEFTAMLREAGFRQVTVHADYQAGQHPADGGRVW